MLAQAEPSDAGMRTCAQHDGGLHDGSQQRARARGGGPAQRKGCDEPGGYAHRARCDVAQPPQYRRVQRVQLARRGPRRRDGREKLLNVFLDAHRCSAPREPPSLRRSAALLAAHCDRDERRRRRRARQWPPLRASGMTQRALRTRRAASGAVPRAFAIRAASRVTYPPPMSPAAAIGLYVLLRHRRTVARPLPQQLPAALLRR